MVRLVGILVALAALTAAGCSSKEQSNTAPTEPEKAPTAAAQPDAATAAAVEPPAEPPSPAEPAQAADPAEPAAPTAPAAPTGGEPAPANLQVLPKAWSRERVEIYMKQQVTRGLGVKCRFCHDTDDFAKDTKHKKEARAMIRMVNEINATYFAGKSRVSCMTCHMGKEEPGEAE